MEILRKLGRIYHLWKRNYSTWNQSRTVEREWVLCGLSYLRQVIRNWRIRLVCCVSRQERDSDSKPLFVTTVNPDTTLIQGNTVKLQFGKGSWGVNLENIPESEYWFREDGRSPWPPSPIMDITQGNIHPDVKEMVDAMWSEDAEYIPSEQDKKILQANANRDFDADPQEIRDWLETTYVEQFKRNLDDSFSSYIEYDGKIYSFEFVIC